MLRVTLPIFDRLGKKYIFQKYASIWRLRPLRPDTLHHTQPHHPTLSGLLLCLLILDFSYKNAQKIATILFLLIALIL